MTTDQWSLGDFVLARVADDESAAKVAVLYPSESSGWLRGEDRGSYIGFHDRINPARVLADCEAKRRIVALMDATNQSDVPADCWTVAKMAVCDLAAVYSDHPDYDERWRS